MPRLSLIIKISIISTFFVGVTVYAFTAIYIANKAYIDNKTKSDVAIVLGAKSFQNGKVNQCVVARVSHAVDLYNQGYVEKIIMSGGNDKKPVFEDTNEGNEMKKIALSLDSKINSEDILVEGKSTSTYENLEYSSKIMKDNNLQSAIIVTEPFHSPRANLVAHKLQMDYTISPTLTSPCWNNGKYFSLEFLREPIAIIAYKLIGQI